MVERMIPEDRVAHYVKHWRRAAEHLAEPYSPDAGEEMLAYVLNRDSLSEVPDVQAELIALDSAFSEALSEASPAWIERLDRWAERGGFATAPWWIAVRHQPARATSAR